MWNAINVEILPHFNILFLLCFQGWCWFSEKIKEKVIRLDNPNKDKWNNFTFCESFMYLNLSSKLLSSSWLSSKAGSVPMSQVSIVSPRISSTSITSEVSKSMLASVWHWKFFTFCLLFLSLVLSWFSSPFSSSNDVSKSPLWLRVLVIGGEIDPPVSLFCVRMIGAIRILFA